MPAPAARRVPWRSDSSRCGGGAINTQRLPYLLIAPSVAFLALLFLWPLAETVLMAFVTPQGVPSTE